jgi:hypothetical protein
MPSPVPDDRKERMQTPQNIPQRPWARFVTRARQVSRRPLLVNLRNVLERIPFKPLEINCLYFLEYSSVPPPHANFLRGRVEVRGATIEDLDGLTACKPIPRVFLQRFKANDTCAVAVLDGRIIGYQWICTKPVYVEERYAYRIEVPSDTIYTYDIFIVPEHRLSGIWFKFHSIYLREMMQRLHRQKIIGMVDYGNRLAMNTHLRFGFKLFRSVFIIKIFRKSLFIARTLRGDTVALPEWVSSPDGAGTPRHTPPAISPAPAARVSPRPEPPATWLPQQSERKLP